MNKPDILFIHASASKKIYQDLANDFSAIEPPIWAGMLCQTAINYGYETDILDCEAEQFNILESIVRISKYNPRIACFVVYGQQPSASTQNMQGATELAAELKNLRPDIKILFIGGHVAALTKETLLQHPEIDFACQNEGVYTMLALLDNKDRLHDIDFLCSIPGLAFRTGEKIESIGKEPIDFIHVNEPAPVVAKERMTLDLPGIAWHKLPMEKYRTSLWHSYTNKCDRGSFASIYTSLGCPFACSFCCINAPFGKRQFRFWDPKEAFHHFDSLRNLGVKNLKIADEMFVYNPKHFMAICDVLIEGKYDFNIWCYARIDTIKEEYLEKLKKAGVNWLGLGIESGVKKVRSDVIKGKFEEVDIRTIVASVDRAGINVAANYIFGLPEDNMESMQQTLDLAIELNTPMANFYSCMAYPGSPLHDQAKQNGWQLPETYSGYSQHSYDCQPLPTKYLTAAQVLEFRDKAWLKYHNRGAHADLIYGKFGSVAEQELIRSTKIVLERKLLNNA